MSLTAIDTLVWKKIYPVISGCNAKVASDVEDILEVSKTALVEGLLHFLPYTKESYEKWKKQSQVMAITEDDEMCLFIHRLSKELDLDVNISWSVICNFLIFEYYGKVDELKLIIRYESNVKSLIDHVWYFYSADRIFLLKTLRYIFEKAEDKKYMYYEQFNKFLRQIDVSVLWKNLLKTFANLTHEIDCEKAAVVSSDTLSSWINRNNREQVDVLLIMTLVVKYLKLNGDELLEVLKLFMRHGFTRNPSYFGDLHTIKERDIHDIKCAEVGVVLAIIRKYWDDMSICKLLPVDVEKDLEVYQTLEENMVILFAWVTLKYTISENHLNYCNDVLSTLIDKKVFKLYCGVLQNKIFHNCKLEEIIMEAVNKLMSEFMKMCTDYRYILEQDGVVEITCELLRHPQLKAIEHFGPFFEIAMEMFPYNLTYFLDMCCALLESEAHYHKVLKLLENMPTFCTELTWPQGPSLVSFRTDETRNLFRDSNLFLIPKGTLATQCNSFGCLMVKFDYRFDFFLVIEQYIKTLTVLTLENKSYIDEKVLNYYVIKSYEFLIFLIKHYRGDFSKNQKLKLLIQRLDCVPVHFSMGNFRNINFFKTYFDAKCALVIGDKVSFNEVFPTMIRKMVFPHITSVEKADQELRTNHTNSDCILFSFLKEEEMNKTHDLLLLYLELIHHTIEKDILHEEIQIGGVWYLINVVFPLHQQWTYEDEEQETKILKICLSVFVKILQYDSEALNNHSKKVYFMCHHAFIYDELVVASLCTIFIKNRFYIQNLMQHESNWIGGPTLEVIDIIRLELVLLLKIFSIRSNISRKINCAIDDKTSLVAKGAAVYVVNSYSNHLTVLSCRFLEVLARDENIPLMASLGLDYDQIQRLFLDRLRDPMEDDDVKLKILDLISTCIFYQNGMTAAFFNVQCSKKWYSDNKKKTLEGDTVADFILDYLENIKTSHEYLKSPLQVGLLKVIANVWITKKHHLIDHVTSLESFWPLLAAPLFKNFTQSPRIYAYIFQIFTLQFPIALSRPKGQELFFKTIEDFLTNVKQMFLLQKFLLVSFMSGKPTTEEIEDLSSLLIAWTEMLSLFGKQNKVKAFPDEVKYLFIELCLDGIKYSFTNMCMLDSWINMTLITFDVFGLNYEKKDEAITRKIIEMCVVIRLQYPDLKVRDRKVSLTLIKKIVSDLKSYFEESSPDLTEFLEEIGPIIDYEYKALQDVCYPHLKRGEDLNLAEQAVPWLIIMTFMNDLLTLKNTEDLAVWLAFRKYLPRVMECVCQFISCRNTISVAKLGIYSMMLYVASPMANDFLSVNMIAFYDQVEPPLRELLLGQKIKSGARGLSEAWITCSVLFKFQQAFIKTFQKNSLPTCYNFLTLYERIIMHIVMIPEVTVHLKALDLLTQTLKFFDCILCMWKVEWYRKSNYTYNFMICAVKKIINSCIYICLRPKNLLFYKFDKYYRLEPVEHLPNDLMIAAMNRLIGAVGIAFTCLYRLNPDLLSMFDVYQPSESILLMILNDFSVPRFELPMPEDLSYGKLLCLAHFLCKTLNQLNQRGGEKHVYNIREEEYASYIGLIEHQDPSEHLPNQKLSSFLRYAMYEYSGLMDPWIENLSYKSVRKTCEVLMTFLAQQAFLTIKTMDPSQVPYYQRNLYSELQFFNEHVKKYTNETADLHPLSPAQASNSNKSDLDLIKRYIISYKEKNKMYNIADKNFLLIISQWFINVCQVR